MHQNFGLSLIQVLARYLLGTKPLPQVVNETTRKYIIQIFIDLIPIQGNAFRNTVWKISAIFWRGHDIKWAQLWVDHTLGCHTIDVYLFENLMSVLNTWTQNMAQHQCNPQASDDTQISGLWNINVKVIPNSHLSIKVESTLLSEL